MEDHCHHAHLNPAWSAGANTSLSTLALGYLQSPPFIFGFFLFLSEGGEVGGEIGGGGGRGRIGGIL